MINLTRLWTGAEQPADGLRYGHGKRGPRSASARKPVVVWNITRTCNLHCEHCYSDSDTLLYPNELSWEEMRGVVDDLAAYGVPSVLLSGGEPLLHPHFFELTEYARQQGLRVTISTNGTRINAERAAKLAQLGVNYVGVSLDGIGEAHDRFRGKVGAFTGAVNGIRHCMQANVKVGLRLTLTQHTVENLGAILDFIAEENIPRVCFYHLVPTGRGAEDQLLDAKATRMALDMILDRVELWHSRGSRREVLTVTNPADGPYLLRRLQRDKPTLAKRAEELLKWNGGANNGPGRGIANIDTQGNVHPDQFWRALTLGNVREQPFSSIWEDTKNPTILGLRSKVNPVNGRCTDCRFLSMCGGGMRCRAALMTGDPWAPDPACYLTDEEVGTSLRPTSQARKKRTATTRKRVPAKAR